MEGLGQHCIVLALTARGIVFNVLLYCLNLTELNMMLCLLR